MFVLIYVLEDRTLTVMPQKTVFNVDVVSETELASACDTTLYSVEI